MANLKWYRNIAYLFRRIKTIIKHFLIFQCFYCVMNMLLIQYFSKGHGAKRHFILSCRTTFKQATDKVADLQKLLSDLWWILQKWNSIWPMWFVFIYKGGETLNLKMELFLLVPNVNNLTSISHPEILTVQKILYESYLYYISCWLAVPHASNWKPKMCWLWTETGNK